MTAPGKRIAMWSGPRNISTALMRAWGNRSDTFVCDEPLYAHYLTRVDAGHPGVDEILRTHDADWRRVVAWLTESRVPESRAIFYQKHMAHHLLPEIDRGWLADVVNCFLIRDPTQMLASLARTLPRPRLADTGLPQQVEIFESVHARMGRVPPVIDARDVLAHPEATLRSLCERVGVPFDAAMLAWPAGPRDTDGVWGKHWYHAVWRSTGFEPHRPAAEPLPSHLEPLLAECQPYYGLLHEHRLVPVG